MRLYIGNPPAYKFDLKVDATNPLIAKYVRLARHWMWRGALMFGAMPTFAGLQLGWLANAAYVLGIFAGAEIALKLDRWAPDE